MSLPDIESVEEMFKKAYGEKSQTTPEIFSHGNRNFLFLCKKHSGEKKILKVFKEELLESFWERLEQQKNILDQMKQTKDLKERIIPIEHIVHHHNSVAITMAHVEGKSLEEFLKDKGGKIGLKDAIILILEIAEVLAFLHEHGFIYQDIKPRNILIMEKNGKLEATICDFEFLEIMESLSATRRIRGTNGYMAPEQITNQKIGKPADIFALGIIFYEMITGTHPFMENKSPNIAAYFESLKKGPKKHNFRGDISYILFNTLAIKQEHRYQDIKDFIQDMNLLLAAQKISRPFIRNMRFRIKLWKKIPHSFFFIFITIFFFFLFSIVLEKSISYFTNSAIEKRRVNSKKEIEQIYPRIESTIKQTIFTTKQLEEIDQIVFQLLPLLRFCSQFKEDPDCPKWKQIFEACLQFYIKQNKLEFADFVLNYGKECFTEEIKEDRYRELEEILQEKIDQTKVEGINTLLLTHPNDIAKWEGIVPIDAVRLYMKTGGEEKKIAYLKKKFFLKKNQKNVTDDFFHFLKIVFGMHVLAQSQDKSFLAYKFRFISFIKNSKFQEYILQQIKNIPSPNEFLMQTMMLSLPNLDAQEFISKQRLTRKMLENLRMMGEKASGLICYLGQVSEMINPRHGLDIFLVIPKEEFIAISRQILQHTGDISAKIEALKSLQGKTIDLDHYECNYIKNIWLKETKYISIERLKNDEKSLYDYISKSLKDADICLEKTIVETEKKYKYIIECLKELLMDQDIRIQLYAAYNIEEIINENDKDVELNIYTIMRYMIRRELAITLNNIGYDYDYDYSGEFRDIPKIESTRKRREIYRNERQRALKILEKLKKNEMPSLLSWEEAELLGLLDKKGIDAIPSLIYSMNYGQEGLVRLHSFFTLQTILKKAKESAIPVFIRAVIEQKIQDPYLGNLKILIGFMIGKIQKEKNCAILLDYLKGKKAENKHETKDLSGKNNISFLLSKLQDKEDSTIRCISIILLGEMGEEAKESLHPLIQICKDQDEKEAIRELAIYALSKMGKDALSILIDIYQAKETKAILRFLIREGIVEAAKDAVSLIKIVQDKQSDKELKAAAIYSLGNIGKTAKDIVPFLIKIVQDKQSDKELKAAAICSLGNIGKAAKDARPVLLEIFKEKKISQEALSAIAKIVEKPSEVNDVILPFLNEYPSLILEALGTMFLEKESELYDAD